MFKVTFDVSNSTLCFLYAHPLSRCFCCTKWENKSNHPIQLGPPLEPRCRIEGWNSWGKGPCLSLFYYYRTKTKGDYFKGILQLIEEVILHGKQGSFCISSHAIFMFQRHLLGCFGKGGCSPWRTPGVILMLHILASFYNQPYKLRFSSPRVSTTPQEPI